MITHLISCGDVASPPCRGCVGEARERELRVQQDSMKPARSLAGGGGVGQKLPVRSLVFFSALFIPVLVLSLVLFSALFSACLLLI